MSAEGAVTVRLAQADGRVARATVSIRRPQAARALIGRTPEEAVRLVPALFSLCGTAQAVAALTACEAALGIDAAAHTSARRLLVLAEMAAVHGWQAAVDWPALLDAPADPAAVKDLRAAVASLDRALYPDGDGLRLGGGRLEADPDAVAEPAGRIAGWINRHVFGGTVPGTADELAAWAGDGATPAARLAARLLEPQLAGFGAGPVPALPALGANWFACRLAADPGFCLLPRMEDGPAVTGPLARRAAHPLVVLLLAEYGTGLAAHMAARLADMAELGRALATEEEAPFEGIGGGGTGCAVVETARGRLAHWLRLDRAGRIADYRIAAPTEWNFAPDGALVRGLEGSPAGPELEERARLLVAMLDPCVPCTVAMDTEDPADA